MKRKKTIILFISLFCLLALIPPSLLPCFSLFAKDESALIKGGGNTKFNTTEKALLKLGLSVLYLDTDDGDYIQSRLEYSPSSMHIALSDEMAEYKNVYTEGTVPVKVKGRGNSTWNNGYRDGKANTLSGDTHTRKVPYNLKLSKKADLFGMGESKRWVLIANYMDRTMMRNKLIYDLSGRMGMTYTKSVYVNLVLNGEYMGVYALTQKIDADLFDGKVTDWEDIAEDIAEEIAKVEKLDDDGQKALEDELMTNLSWVTSGEFHGYKLNLEDHYPYTGYLLEYDGYADEASFFQTSHGVPLKVKNMEYIKTNSDIFSYLTSYFYYFEEALYSDTFYNSVGKHYSEYLDMSSFVDYYILNAIILNVEFGYKSMFMYISDEGKLVLGPCWDYDWSSGNPFLHSNGDYNQWYNDGRGGNNHWYHQVYSDPWFVALLRERWLEVYDMIQDMIDSMSDLYEYLAPTEELEYEKFSSDPYESDFAWRTGGRSFVEECYQLQTFLQNRFDWMYERFCDRDPNIENRGLRSSSSFKIDVQGASGTVAAPDKEEEYYSADVISSEFQDLKVRFIAAKDDDLKVYLNGELIAEKLIYSTAGTFTVSIPKEKFTNGVNVVTAIKNLWRDGQDIMYCSIKMPGVKPSVPSVNDKIKLAQEEKINELVPERIEQPNAEKTMPTAVVIGVPAAILTVCGSVFAVLAFIGVQNKKSKNKNTTENENDQSNSVE